MVCQALDKSTKYLYQYDYFKQTAFHWAAKLGYDKMLEKFLKLSKRCNIYDKNLRTPLYLAAMNNHKKCVLLLLDNGGNPFTEQPFNFIYQNDNNRKKSSNKKKSRYTLKQNNINQK